MMTPFSRENAILNELPKVEQIEQKWAKKEQKQVILQTLPYFSKTTQ